MEGTLNSILDGTDTEIEQEEVAEAAETEQVEETGEVVAAEPEPERAPEPAGSVTPTDEPDDVKGLRAALKAERRKRQEAEQQARSKAEAFDPNVFYQDPAYIQSFVEQRMSAQAINISREFAKQQFEDYEEMEELFAEEAERNPALIHELRNHPAPALFAYQTAKQLKTVREAQDGSLEARIRAEVEAKVRAEYEAKQKPAAQVPPDLAGARSVPGNDAPPDESIDSILSRKR